METKQRWPDYDILNFRVVKEKFTEILTLTHNYWGLERKLLLAQPAENALYSIQEVIRR